MTLKEVSPRKVLAQVAAAVPPEIHPNIVIIGSLAAGYWLFQRASATFGVRTKDVDCVLSPYISAVERGREVAETLLEAGWNPREDGEFAKPGDAATPTDRLPAVRLYPPGGGEWFIELLTEPASEAQRERVWTRLRWRLALTTRCPASRSPRWRHLTLSGPISGSGALDQR